MVATHTIKLNGKWYRAGEELPAPTAEKVETKTTEKITNEKPYTKSEITLMKAAELRELAAQNGIDNAEEYTGSELKRMLIEKFEL